MDVPLRAALRRSWGDWVCPIGRGADPRVQRARPSRSASTVRRRASNTSRHATACTGGKDAQLAIHFSSSLRLKPHSCKRCIFPIEPLFALRWPLRCALKIPSIMHHLLCKPINFLRDSSFSSNHTPFFVISRSKSSIDKKTEVPSNSIEATPITRIFLPWNRSGLEIN